MAVEETKKKLYRGIVVSDKMDKTIVAAVERITKSPLTHKTVKKIKKYKVHDVDGKAHVGDIIEFYEGRPISKTKFMYLHQIAKRNNA